MMQKTVETLANSFPKYDNYKDSGVDWLGEIPAEWEILPLKAITNIKSICGFSEETLLSVYLDKGVIRFDDIKELRLTLEVQHFE